MKVPNEYSAYALKNWDTDRQSSAGHWTPARPFNLESLSLFRRFYLAFLVLTGKRDVLRWDES